MITRVRIPGLNTDKLPGGLPVKGHILQGRAQKAGLKLEAIRALDGEQTLVGYEVLSIRHEFREAAGEAWLEWLADNWTRHLPDAILGTKTQPSSSYGYGLGMNVDTGEILKTRSYTRLRQALSRTRVEGRHFPLTLEWTETYDRDTIESLKMTDETALALAAKRLTRLAQDLAFIAIDDAASPSRCYSAMTRVGALVAAGLAPERIVLKFDLNANLPLFYAQAITQAHPGPVVLEGVSSDERFRLARQIGVDWVQGFAVSDTL